MKLAEYEERAKSLLGLAAEIENKKRPDYTIGDEDVLHNFKNVAKRAGVSPLQVWLIYFLKHVDAISMYAHGNTNPSEPIIQRFADAVNYLKLGEALAFDLFRETMQAEDMEHIAEVEKHINGEGCTSKGCKTDERCYRPERFKADTPEAESIFPHVEHDIPMPHIKPAKDQFEFGDRVNVAQTPYNASVIGMDGDNSTFIIMDLNKEAGIKQSFPNKHLRKINDPEFQKGDKVKVIGNIYHGLTGVVAATEEEDGFYVAVIFKEGDRAQLLNSKDVVKI